MRLQQKQSSYLEGADSDHRCQGAVSRLLLRLLLRLRLPVASTIYTSDSAALSADTRYVLPARLEPQEMASKAITADKHTVYVAIHLH